MMFRSMASDGRSDRKNLSKLTVLGALALAASVVVASAEAAPSRYRIRVTHDHAGIDACDLVPPTSQHFAVNARPNRPGGVSKPGFMKVLKAINDVYTPVFRERGQRLILRGLWENGDPNAVAYPGRDPIEVLDERGGVADMDMSFRRVDIYGGLARHPEMTVDSLAMVVCHEIGHHMGGAPVKANSWGPSNEGQSDYFSASKCMRRVLDGVDNEQLMNRSKVDPRVRQKCFAAHQRDMKEASLCMRISMGGLALARTLSDLGDQGRIDFDSPDRTAVAQTDNSHPAAQCRLDTYFAGALCRIPYTTDLSVESPLKGACVPERATNSAGIRPSCWFNPKFYDRPELITRF